MGILQNFLSNSSIDASAHLVGLQLGNASSLVLAETALIVASERVGSKATDEAIEEAIENPYAFDKSFCIHAYRAYISLDRAISKQHEIAIQRNASLIDVASYLKARKIALAIIAITVAIPCRPTIRPSVVQAWRTIAMLYADPDAVAEAMRSINLVHPLAVENFSGNTVAWFDKASSFPRFLQDEA